GNDVTRSAILETMGDRIPQEKQLAILRGIVTDEHASPLAYRTSLRALRNLANAGNHDAHDLLMEHLWRYIREKLPGLPPSARIIDALIEFDTRRIPFQDLFIYHLLPLNEIDNIFLIPPPDDIDLNEDEMKIWDVKYGIINHSVFSPDIIEQFARTLPPGALANLAMRHDLTENAVKIIVERTDVTEGDVAEALFNNNSPEVWLHILRQKHPPTRGDARFAWILMRLSISFDPAVRLEVARQPELYEEWRNLLDIAETLANDPDPAVAAAARAGLAKKKHRDVQ
ncbi:MAG: hypothetical protein Q6365_023160, partial [Candidatus Sigynarchaeota archaeon]